MVKIIMATYNGAKYITEQVESVMKSEYRDFHLYVFDDCSKDDTIFSLEFLSKKYPDMITIVQNETNKGHTGNFLEGLHEVAQDGNEKDYYMFCDQDDIWMPKKIGITVAAMEAMEKKYGKSMPLLVFTDARIMSDRGERLGTFIKQSHYEVEKRDVAHILMENKGMGCTMMMNHALASKLQKYPEYARHHDWWFMLAASALGHTAFVNRPTLLYRQHGNNEVGVSGFAQYAVGRVKKLKAQKKQIEALYLQAEEFFQTFKSELSEENKRVFRAFTEMKKQGWLARRKTALKYGFLKSGIVRNIGLMIIL